MANITYHRFDEDGRYTETLNAPEENINFEDPSKIYVGDVFHKPYGDLNVNPATSSIDLYYHDFNTNAPVLKPENTNPSVLTKFDYTTKQWVQETPVELTEEELAASVDAKWQYIRAQRKLLLNSTDWTQLPDVPLTTKEAWATYRQALRDVTTQLDPFNITWPTKPE
jgi:hypothetical protein